MKKNICTLLSTLFVLGATAQNPWLHIYQNSNKYNAYKSDNIKEIYFTGDGDSFSKMNIVTNNEGTKTFDMSNIKKWQHAPNVPNINITTDTYISEIQSKTEYLTGTFEMDGNGIYNDVSATVNIRGRGNSTWKYSKKPYRLKFDKKISLCNLKKAKSYVLLANYIDPTLMRNALAMKIAQLLEIPYANHMVPVNVTLNGQYKGSYMLTEKVGINAGSVDIDETNSILWELDKNYDEEWKFRSPIYRLPVMIKDPDMPENTTEASSLFSKWQSDFIEFEKGVKDGRLSEVADMESVVNCFILFAITGNQEFCHPKSFYMYKTIDPASETPSKYIFGPVWDFDWCYGYNGRNHSSLLSPEQALNIHDTSMPGCNFAWDIMHNAEFKTLFDKKWNEFIAGKLPEFWEYFDYYATLIEPTTAQNSVKWSQTANRDQHIERLRLWIKARIEYIGTAPNHGLY